MSDTEAEKSPGEGAVPAHLVLRTRDAAGDRLSLRAFRERAERAYILATLEAHAWVVSRAAEALGIERTNLHKKLSAHGITRRTP